MKQTFSNLVQKATLAFISLNYAPALFAKDWFPKVEASDDMTQKGNSAMKVLSSNMKKGLALLLLAVCAGSLFKFVSTVSHGIEEAKKSENGSIAIFANYTIMAALYLAMSIGSGYVALSMINNFEFGG